MSVIIILPPEVVAMAHDTARLRPESIPWRRRNPSNDPEADLVGAMGEYAFAYHCGLPYISVNSVAVQQPDGKWGDGGWDFTFGKTTVDVKASRRHRDSFVVPGRNFVNGEWVEGLKADWYVFAYVTLPGTVNFRYKAHRDVLIPMGNSLLVGGTKRLVYGEEISPFEEQDFKEKVPRRPSVHKRP